MRGAPSCRSHGGKGILKRAFVPAHVHLSGEQVQTLEDLMKEDDQSLKREFHLLRLFLSIAIEQFQNASATLAGDTPADVIGELRRLAGIVDKLSGISERRAKISAITPREEQVVRVQFDDPKVLYLFKEKLREMHVLTIRKVLAIVIQYADPKGELGIAQRLPSSFAPFLPPGGDVRQLGVSESEQGFDALDNADMTP